MWVLTMMAVHNSNRLSRNLPTLRSRLRFNQRCDIVSTAVAARLPEEVVVQHVVFVCSPGLLGLTQ